MIANVFDLDLQSVAKFGGKAAALGEMHRCGIPVAAGCAVSVEDYRAYAHRADIARDLEGFWTIFETSTSAELSSQIGSGFNKCLPLELAADILRCYGNRFGQHLIVRSSATAEDSRGVSFAGQFLSVTCQAEAHDLAKAIAAVWSSATMPNVKTYIRTMRSTINTSAIEMAVVIQAYVRCDLSGLLFAHHPTVAVQGWALVEFATGGPEALVSGRVVPSRWRVNMTDHRVIVESSANDKATLSLLDAATLVEYGSLLRRTFGGEVDIEWGKSADKLILFQCRPVTVLPNKPDRVGCPHHD